MTEEDRLIRLTRIQEQHDDRLRELEIKFSGFAENQKNVKEDLDSIKSDVKWLLRLIIGAILSAIIIYMIRGGFSIQVSP